MSIPIGKTELLSMYQKMLMARVFEEKAIELFTSGQLPGFLHSAVGQEAIPVGICAHLRKTDTILTTHRGHADILAKGADPKLMMAELFGRETGYCCAKGGSMHMADYSNGILGPTGIVGAGLPIANGPALAAQLLGTDDVSVCFFGDGASNEGFFHEALNLAAVWNLPVLFVCSNNLYGESTHQRFQTKTINISDRAAGYGMAGVTVDGNDVVAVYEVAKAAVERARAGEGPTLIEGKTYRWFGHYIGDPCTYRPQGELEEWKKKDPIPNFKAWLLSSAAATEDELTSLERAVVEAIDEAVAYAKASPEPAAESALEGVWA